MRILIDINHPAQVHLFRGAIAEWSIQGHEVLVVARDKDITLRLLDLYRIPYRRTGREQKWRYLNLVFGFIEAEISIWRAARQFDPDWMVGTSFAIAHASKLVRGRSIVFAEDAVKANRLFWLLVDPFADFIATPDLLTDDHGPGHLKYPSYQKLAYLHPKRFEPDPSIVDDLGIETGQSYSLLRFVSFQASHDIGQKGITDEVKRHLVSELSSYGPVFISSEAPLSGPLKKYALDISPTRIHHALAFASLLVSESASMVTEAAILGTPALYCSSLVGSIPVIDELEKRYGLAFQYSPSSSQELLEKVKDLMDLRDRKEQWRLRREKMLAEKIDLTEWIVNLPSRL